ncbi:hypothetical protein [Rhodopirellula bahusiensis]|uniref:hypothetical protein n=1 Tax=Rhodopirellula bahusiensis TaxID=2014065 RepID=UPI0032647A5C
MNKCERNYCASLVVFMILSLAFTDVHAQIVDNEITAARYLDAYLKSASEVDGRFACWIESKEFGIVPNSDVPVEFSRELIYANDSKNSWRFSSLGMHGNAGPKSTTWWQYLETSSHGRIGFLGVRGRGTLISKDDDRVAKQCAVKFSSPIYRSVLDAVDFRRGTCSELQVARLFGDIAKFKSGRHVKGKGDFIAVWESIEDDFSVEIEVCFGKKSGFMPIRCVRTVVENGVRRPWDVTATRWEKQSHGYLPMQYTYMHEDCSGKTHLEGEAILNWKVGSEVPAELDGIEEGDWRLQFCLLFDRNCYRYDEAILDRETVRRALFSPAVEK